jgi:hypothetical protein
MSTSIIDASFIQPSTINQQYPVQTGVPIFGLTPLSICGQNGPFHSDNFTPPRDYHSFDTYIPSNCHLKAGPSTQTYLPTTNVPRCSICSQDSTGIHFGAEACSACAAYFRRTVVLKRVYVCSRNGNCDVQVFSKNRKKCKSCRYQRCLKMGMDINAVQGRRDAIGKYSTAFTKRDMNESKSFIIEIEVNLYQI